MFVVCIISRFDDVVRFVVRNSDTLSTRRSDAGHYSKDYAQQLVRNLQQDLRYYAGSAVWIEAA